MGRRLTLATNSFHQEISPTCASASTPSLQNTQVCQVAGPCRPAGCWVEVKPISTVAAATKVIPLLVQKLRKGVQAYFTHLW